MAASRFLGHPIRPTQGSELAYGDPHPPVPAGLHARPRAAPSPETPAAPGCRKWPDAQRAREVRAAVWRPRPAGSPRAWMETTPGFPSLPYAGPPGRLPELPARSPPSWRRPCRRSAPPARPAAPAAAAAPGPPCRSWLGLASRLARLLARPPVRSPVAAEAAAAHAHWLAGRPKAQAAGSAAARALSLARRVRCGWRR